MASCCEPEPNAFRIDTTPWADGTVTTRSGPVPRVRTALSGRDCRGMLWCRLSNRYRMHYRVNPGLYAVGNAGPESPAFVSANYKMSFDTLRAALAGLDAWVLVLDTKGINVWCAAGKGTFGTDEIVRRVEASGLSQVVTHRRLVVPQLGAPGVKAHEVERLCGFHVVYGPVRAADIPAFIRGRCEATAAMRTVRFGLRDRCALAPMELWPALHRYLWFTLALLAFFGLYPQGILFRQAIVEGGLVVGAGAAALAAGAGLFAVLLPWLPTRWFALKGWFLGAAAVAAVDLATRGAVRADWRLASATYLFFPAVSSYIALNFTGCTTFTGPSGVKRELRIALPAYLAAAAGAAVLLAVYKLDVWGIL